jgi:hypothetical protein
MDTIFWICVRLMQLGSQALGISYQAINVLLFVLIHPAITIYFYLQFRKYKRRWEAERANNALT